MVDFIMAEEDCRNAKIYCNVVAENPLGDVDVKRLFVSEDISGKTLKDVVLDEIFKEISKQSYFGKNRAKIAIIDRKIVKNINFNVSGVVK